MPSIQTILNQGGQTYIKELAKTMRKNGQVVSGETLSKVRYTVQGGKLTVFAPRYSGVLVGGRKPGAMPPVAPLIKWFKRKGLDGKQATSAAWGLAKIIQKKGTQLYRGADPRFTKPTDTFTEPIEPTLKEIKKDLTNLVKVQLLTDFKKAFA